MAIILQMRERMEEMQRQIQEFVQYIQQEVLTRANAAADPVQGSDCARAKTDGRARAAREETLEPAPSSERTRPCENARIALSNRDLPPRNETAS